jgi:hypothetical protein
MTGGNISCVTQRARYNDGAAGERNEGRPRGTGEAAGKHVRDTATAHGEQAWCSTRAIRTTLRRHRVVPERPPGPVPEEGAVFRKGRDA